MGWQDYFQAPSFPGKDPRSVGQQLGDLVPAWMTDRYWGMMPPDPRAEQAISRMRAATQIMPGDMPVGAPIPQAMPPQGFAPQPANRGDPESPTGAPRPAARLNPGGAMPSTTPDVIQTAMAPVGGSAGPGTEIYGETYPTAPMPPMPQQPSAARGVMDEMMLNRGDKAPWLALAAAGFGTAAGTSPHAMTNIGQGGLKGIQMYSDMTDRAARDRLAAATALMRAEQDDRQAGFEQQKIGQGAERIGVEREGLGIRRGEIQQRREEAAAKLRHEERKLDIEQPERQARSNYYNAMASAVPDKQTTREQQAINMIVDNARQEALAVATNKTTGEFDKATFDAAKKASLLEQAQAMGIDPARLGVFPPAPPPEQRRPGGVYDTPRGPMKWTGSGWVPGR